MAMKPPRTIRVGFREMGLCFLPEIELGDARGQWRPGESRIVVGSYLSPQDQAETVLHEVLHGCYPSFDMPETVGSDDVEELVVSTLAANLSQVIRDNPKLVSWLRTALRRKNTDTA